ncbi:hypothetical protein FOL47_000520, partial [Perkinsus chesapeaki]
MSTSRQAFRSPADRTHLESLASAAVQLRALEASPFSSLIKPHKKPPAPRQIAQFLCQQQATEGSSISRILQLSAYYMTLSSVSATSLRQYLSGRRCYISFVDCLAVVSGRTLLYFPPSSSTLRLWLSTFRSSATAANYLTHVRKWASLLHLEEGALRDPILELGLRGLSNLNPAGTRKMLPLHLRKLAKIVTHVKSSSGRASHIGNTRPKLRPVLLCPLSLYA